jgi:hypothetical protein
MDIDKLHKKREGLRVKLGVFTVPRAVQGLLFAENTLQI